MQTANADAKGCHASFLRRGRPIQARTMDTTCSLQCAWFAVHLIGCGAACLLRVCEGRRAEGPLQALFLLCFAVVGVSALAGRQFGWSPWTLSSATLALMVVAAIADLRPAQ